MPHHLVADDGTPGAAVLSGCQAVLARVAGSNIPDGDKAGVRAHAQHHIDAYQRSQAAARAEAFVAKLPDNPPSDEQRDVEDGVVAAGAVTAGYSELDYARSERAPLELILGKPWAITRQAGIEVATRLALQAQGHMRGDEQLARMQAAARQPLTHPKASDGSEIAVIPLRGTITPRGTLFSLVFGGGGGLQLFRDQFRMAIADGNVSAVVLDIDSPGGLIDLVPETTAEVLSARGSKPIVAVANTTTASAAYWIASAADNIVATPSAQVGSIGVFTIHEDYSRMEEMMGIKTTLVSAGPFKTDGNPFEPLSKTARAALQQEVNDLYTMFTGQVAQGRGVSIKAVQAGYGRGRSLLADQAYQVGMVDRVATLEQTVAKLGGNVRIEQTSDADTEDTLEARDETPELVAADNKTSPESGEKQRDVSAPSADYLSSSTPSGYLL